MPRCVALTGFFAVTLVIAFRAAAAEGAQVILPSELFQGPYFCVSQEEKWFATAHPWREHPCVTALAPVAAEQPRRGPRQLRFCFADRRRTPNIDVERSR